mmetsp:Transcript_9950/g.27094  ORF Transcript_9950/g.27094 Transcript_9950/m.27094 type:complete len:201 (+) Transcript_9950:242-844(+)
MDALKYSRLYMTEEDTGMGSACLSPPDVPCDRFRCSSSWSAILSYAASAALPVSAMISSPDSSPVRFSIELMIAFHEASPRAEMSTERDASYRSARQHNRPGMAMSPNPSSEKGKKDASPIPPGILGNSSLVGPVSTSDVATLSMTFSPPENDGLANTQVTSYRSIPTSKTPATRKELRPISWRISPATRQAMRFDKLKF